jgi:hypothetical protein
MTTIEFPNKGRNQDENAAGEAELELQPEGEALDLDVDEEAQTVSASSPATAAPAKGQGPASIGIALLLIVSLVAVGVLWKQRIDLRAQVAGLESTLAEAEAREAATRTTVGDVATQLEAIQTVLASLLTAQASDEVGSETEAATAPPLADPEESAPAEPAGGSKSETGEAGWVDRALNP